MGSKKPRRHSGGARKNEDNYVEQALLNNKMGLCVKNQSHVVLYQNQSCKDICSEITGACDEGCMKLYLQDPKYPDRSEGVQFFSNATIKRRPYDVVVLSDPVFLTTLLYPLEKKYKREWQRLQDRELSKREKEIMALVSRGASNREMADQLHIAKSTLKTHLNNIYKKFTDLKGLRKR